MCDALGVRIILALLLAYTVPLYAVKSMADLNRACDNPLVSCNKIYMNSQHSRAQARSLSPSSPVFYKTTTTTSAPQMSEAEFAHFQYDVFLDTDSFGEGVSPPLTFCMWNLEGPREILQHAVVTEFFLTLYELGGLKIRIGDKETTATQMVVYINMIQASASYNARLVDILVQQLDVHCIWLGSDSPEMNIITANHADRYGQFLIAPYSTTPELTKRGAHVFSLAPDALYFLDTSLDVVCRTRYINNVAYIYTTEVKHKDGTVSDDLERAKCSRIDTLAATWDYEVIYSRGANSSELSNATLELQTLYPKPDLVVLCTEDMDYIMEFVDNMYAAHIEPKAVIIGSPHVGTEQFLLLAQDKGRYIIGVDLWAPTLNTTSDLIFTNMTNSELEQKLIQMSIGNGFQSAATSQYVMLWTALELAAWALATAPMPETGIDLLLAADKLATLKNHNRSSFVGEIRFDAHGQRVSDFLSVQWQQQYPGADSPNIIPKNIRLDKVQVVAPVDYASQWLWFPKPTLIEKQCFRTDNKHGLYGFSHIDEWGEYRDCRECDLGSHGKIIFGVVYGLEAFNEIRIRACEKCPAGKHSQISIADLEEVNCKQCDVGKYTSQPGRSICESCARGAYQHAQGQSSCLLCEVGRFNDRLAQTECMACEYPSVAVKDGTAKCTACPDGASCPETDHGYSTYTSKEGFYILGPDNGLSPDTWTKYEDEYPLGVVYACPYIQSVCLDNNTCAEEDAMHGPFCGTCKPGHEKGGPFQACQKCPSMFIAILYQIWDNLFLMGLTLLIYFECIVSKTPHDHQTMIVLKQLLSYSWMMARFNPWLRLTLGGQQGEDGVYKSEQPKLWTLINHPSVAYQCILQEIAPDMEVSYSMIVAAFVNFVPLALIQTLIASLLEWPVRRCCFFGLRKVPVRDKLVALFVITIYWQHARATADFSDVWRCLKYDRVRLLRNPQITCDSEEHKYWQTVSGVGFTLVSIGLPFVFYIILRMHESLWSTQGMRKYGFLHLGYKHEYWYWESVLMLRKVMFAVVPSLSIFIGSEDDEHSRWNSGRVVLLVISIAFYALNRVSQPWDERSFLLLDELDQSMMEAFTVMFLLQVLIHDTYAAEVTPLRFHISGITVTVITSIFHFRFLYLVAKGLCGPLMSCSKVCACMGIGAKWKELRKQSLEIRSEGLDAKHLGPRSRLMLVHVFQRIAAIHLDHGEVFEIKEFVKTVQKISVMAAYFKKLEHENGVRAGEVYDDHHNLIKGETFEGEDNFQISEDEINSCTDTVLRRGLTGISTKTGSTEEDTDTSLSKESSFNDKVTYGWRKQLTTKILDAQNQAELYEGTTLSPAAIFRSYLRERTKIGEEVKQKGQQTMMQTHKEAAEEMETWREAENEDDEMPDFFIGDVVSAMNRVSGILKDLPKESTRASIQDRKRRSDLPEYRVLASHVRELEFELDEAMKENALLLNAAEKTTSPMEGLLPVVEHADDDQRRQSSKTVQIVEKNGTPKPSDGNGTLIPEKTQNEEGKPAELHVEEGVERENEGVDDAEVQEEAAADAPLALQEEPAAAEASREVPAAAAAEAPAGEQSEGFFLQAKHSLAHMMHLDGETKAAPAPAETPAVLEDAKSRQQALKDEIAMLTSQIEEEMVLKLESQDAEEGSLSRDVTDGSAPQVLSQGSSSAPRVLSQESSLQHESSERSVQNEASDRTGTYLPSSSSAAPAASTSDQATTEFDIKKAEGQLEEVRRQVSAFPTESRKAAAKKKAASKQKEEDKKVDQVSPETAEKLQAVKQEIVDLEAKLKISEREAEELATQNAWMERVLVGQAQAEEIEEILNSEAEEQKEVKRPPTAPLSSMHFAPFS